MYINLYTPSIFLSRNSFTVLSSLEDNDDTYDADTCTSKDCTTLLTLLVDTPLKYDSSIMDSTDFSTLE